MGLKFERSDELEKLFDSFAVAPEKKEMPLEELEKQTKKADSKETKKTSKNNEAFSLKWDDK